MTTQFGGSLSQTFFALDRFIGDSAWTRRVRRRILDVSKLNDGVLLYGPQGTGKRLVARAIHTHGPRAAKPFIPVRCATLPGELFPSQLFGVSGPCSTVGCLICAEGGTLFLEEVAALDREQQLALLKSLQSKSVTPLGGDQPVEFDVRIIASSAKDLEHEVREGRFYLDLYYLLSCLPIETIPLASRRCDIPSLVNHFVAKATLESGKSLKRIAPEAMAALCRSDWPGNVMQLQRVVENAIENCSQETIQLDDLSIDVSLNQRRRDWPTLSEAEAMHVRNTLRATNYDFSQSAELLGVTRAELEAKMQQFGCSQTACM